MTFHMKYVVVNRARLEEIYLFPNFITHSNFAFNMNLNDADIVSAGFVSPNLECYGESVSLKKASRTDVDTALLDRTLGTEDD